MLVCVSVLILHYSRNVVSYRENAVSLYLEFSNMFDVRTQNSALLGLLYPHSNGRMYFGIAFKWCFRILVCKCYILMISMLFYTFQVNQQRSVVYFMVRLCRMSSSTCHAMTVGLDGYLERLKYAICMYGIMSINLKSICILEIYFFHKYT